MYFMKLSELLNEASTSCPSLSGLTISHLAWADDLVILALDPESLQKQLTIIENYCRDWGLEINISKTKFMVMNGKQPPSPNWRPTLNGQPIEPVTSYCYLGIIINNNGKLKQAVDSLYKKGLGAYFSLRNTIDRRFIDAKSSDKLFETLVAPILTYGCQVWLPTLPVIKHLTSCFKRNGNINQSLPQIAKMPQEQVHLRHLKHLLGINRRASNTTAWGETGKQPLLINNIKLCIKYFNRVMNLPSTHFAKAALIEQIRLNLSWFTNIKCIIECFDDVQPSEYEKNSSAVLNATLLSDISSFKTVAAKLQEHFVNSWKSSIDLSSKLTFYKSIKSSFSWEPYLDHSRTFNERRSTARIRCSSHRLNIEVGRFSNTPRDKRTCDFCNSVSNPIAIEDENHLLRSCPIGDKERFRFAAQAQKLGLEPAPSFSIAETYPKTESTSNRVSEQDVDMSLPIINAPSKEKVEYIKLCTRTVHNMYKLVLKHKESLKKSSQTRNK